ncbi:MAG TPA: alpha/beta hydrolase [Amycolatopsis sp.]|nr:alpha/beta hydrolase [Amycolatopsis sp.]
MSLDAAQPVTRTVEVRGARVGFSEFGGEGPDVLLVHGSRAHRGWWHGVAEALHGHRVRAMDLTGHGSSDHRPAYEIGTWVEEIVAVAADRRPLLVGHSLGGRAALTAAAARPAAFAGLVLVDAPIRPPRAYLENRRTATTRPPRTTVPHHPTKEAAFARFRLFPEQPMPTAEVMARLAAHSVRSTPHGWTWSHDQLGEFPDLYSGEAEQALRRCFVPLTYVYGGRSGLMTEEEAQWVAANHAGPTRLVRVAGGYHHLPLDSPRECADAIRDALRSE